MTTIRKHSASVGTGSPQAMVVVEDDVLFVDQVGQIQQLSGIQEFGSIGSQNLSDVDQMTSLLRNEFDLPENLAKIRAAYYARKREVHFAFPSVGAPANDRRVVLDLSKQGPRWRVSDRDVSTALWLRLGLTKEQQLVAGDDAGFVWLLDRSAKNKDGVGYSTYIQTANLDFSHADPALAGRNKIGQFLELIFDSIGAFDTTVEVFWDGILTHTIIFGGEEGGIALGSFQLDIDKLVSTTVVTERRRLEGSGKYLALAFSNNNADEDFSLARALVSFKVGDER